MSERDDRLADELRAALGSERTPPDDRVSALRALTDQHRRDAAREARPAPRRLRLARRQLLTGGLAASLGAALGAGAYAVLEDDPAVPLEPVEVAALREGVRAEAQIIDHTWGVEYLLEVSGLPAGRAYDVVYRTAGGGDLAAGSFLGVTGTVTCRMTAAVRRDRTRAIEVRDEEGAVLLRSRLSA